MRASEVVGALCVNSDNETVMSDFLDADLLQRFFELVSTKDVLICVNMLDSLYNVSFFDYIYWLNYGVSIDE
jgi:hypothetical protein